MSVPFNKFNAFMADKHNGVHNLGSDVLKWLFTNSAPVATNSVKADLTEISAGNGYSAGGPTQAITSSTQTAGTYKLLPASQPVITASGSIGPFRYVALYNSTASGGPLIGWSDYGSSITLTTSGDTFTVGVDLTNGVFTDA